MCDKDVAVPDNHRAGGPVACSSVVVVDQRQGPQPDPGECTDPKVCAGSDRALLQPERSQDEEGGIIPSRESLDRGLLSPAEALEDKDVGKLQLLDGQGPTGGSGFWSSVFNGTNVLMGVGLLSLPYTMRLSGWVGLILLGLVAAITMYTALLLGRIMTCVPKTRLREGPGAYTITGFTDMGQAAFGSVGKPSTLNPEP